MHDPRDLHFTALKRILRYVYGTLDYGLQLHVSSTTQLSVYTDADWAGCLVTRRSTSGYCAFLGDNLLSWSAKCQVTFYHSSAEAEYRGVANVVAETAWIRNLLCELHTRLFTATLVYCENVSAVYMSTNLIQHQRTNHIEIDIHFVCDFVASGQVRVLHVPSRFQYFSFGRHLDELHMTWAHLEKKRTRLRTNTKTLEDLCLQSLKTASPAMHDAVTTHQVTAVPHHGLDLWSLTQFLYDHVDDYTRMDLDFAADGNLGELSGEEAWETIEKFSQGQKERDNPPNIIFKHEIQNLKVHAKRLFGNENVWVEMHMNIVWDKVENSDPQSTPQVLQSFEEYTLPVTCPEEVEETLGTPLEGSSLVCYESKPQPNPLPNCLSLDVSLGEERVTEPPIKPHSLDSFRMKEVDSLTINTPSSPHVAYSHPKDTLYLMRRSLKVLRKSHWMILGGQFNQLSHVSSPLLSKPGEY
ncbi:ribonuclease H-like domain-containing protein [Tanacetum coccineum]